ncbi:DNA-binding transcriptional regulator, LysR family [Duganella sacchari]|uniref:DNA-binding transcriptional regulator, LysR family n=2 Tax=Duganella sacchari TaxID=551987 RepID=A0A1M7Q4D4_9BURK|nr:DNA-binding transcriptional regulator, LysR family [Duganella sacchari]
MDRLTSMSVFVRAVDLGSFAAAADALDISAPMVGKHILFLEQRLGVRLLNRTTRRQSLTDFGKAYYDRCRSILAEVDAADGMAADQLAQPSGRLRVSMPQLFGRVCALPVLMALTKKYPGLELDLAFGDGFADLAGNGVDLAIRSLARDGGGMGNQAGVVARLLRSDDMLVCAAPSYLKKHGTPARPDALPSHQAIMFARHGHAQPWRFPQTDGSYTEYMPHHRLRLDDLSAIVDAACTGAGLAWLPRWLVSEQLQAGKLKQVLVRQPPLVYDHYAMWLQSPQMPLKTRAAIDALVASFNDGP